MAETERIAVDAIPEDVSERLAAVHSEIEQLRVQLAGCSAAALGATAEENIATEGMYGCSPAYQDVLDLRRKYETVVTDLCETGAALTKVREKPLKATAKIAEVGLANAECAGVITDLLAKEAALSKVWSFLWNQFVESPGMEVYGYEFQEIGEKAGLLHQVPFDPEVHGEGVEADRGELIFVLTDLGRSCVQEKTSDPTT